MSITREERIGGQRLILGDCLEIMPLLGRFDAVVTDPPYGISHRRGKSGNRGKGFAKGSSGIQGDTVPFDPSHFIGMPCLLWGANHFANSLPRGRWIIWDKTLGAGSGDFSEFEVAWCSEKGADRFIRHMWMGVQRASENGEKRQHDTQKPVEVMRQSILALKRTAPRTILDPFMGSGTTLVACQRMGLNGTGIEVDPVHFETACRRVDEATRQPDMFITPAAKPAHQETLL